MPDTVNTYIRAGFQPYSEPFLSKNSSGDVIYCQAMVEYED